MITYHSEVFKRTRALDVLQSLLQVLQFRINLRLGLLCALDRLSLEGLNRFNLAVDVVFLDLKAAHLLLEIANDILVLQGPAVVLEVDSLRLLGEHLHPSPRVVIALLEVGEGRGCVSSEAEFGA